MNLARPGGGAHEPTESGGGVLCRGEVLWRCVPGFVVVATCDGAVLRVEGTGSAIWDLIDGTRTFDQLVSALCEQFDADPAELRADVAAVVARLVEFGAVHRGPDPVGLS